jgi:hypothetical protein
MSQLAVLALAALVGWLLWRNFSPALANRRQPSVTPKRDATTLERDPSTGIYRASDRD